MSNQAVHPTVRFGRLERRSLLLGLSGPQTGLLGAALVITVAGLYLAGGMGLAAALPVAGPLTAAALLRRDGQPLVAWLPVAVHWRARRATSQTRFVTRLANQHPAESLGLPGDAARLRLVESDLGAALVHDPHARTLTAVLRVGAPPFLLADPPARQRLVAGYGRLLAALSQLTGVTRLQVLERTVAEPALRLRGWWQQHGVHDGGWAAGVLSDLISDAAQSSDRHEAYLAVSIGTEGRTGRPGAARAALEALMGTVDHALDGADLISRGWLDPGALVRVVRTAYDPAAAAAPNPELGCPAGPMAAHECWDRVHSDAAHHAVYWISEWPRTEIAAGFLQPLVLMPGVRRSLSIVAEPVSATQALRDIRRVKVEQAADAVQRTRLGQVEDEAAEAAAADVVRRERELLDGHAELRFAGLVALTADTEEELDRACGQLEQAAARAMCELRLLYGQQGQAFAAAALPLCRGLA